MVNWLIIGILVVAGILAWAWLSTAFGRFALGLTEARCPHCRQVNTLDVADQVCYLDLGIMPRPIDDKGTRLICERCGKTCYLSDLPPAATPEEEPTPQPPVAA